MVENMSMSSSICFQVKFLLGPGDLMCFNNHRILHAREAFELNGGMRHLQVRTRNIVLRWIKLILNY